MADRWYKVYCYNYNLRRAHQMTLRWKFEYRWRLGTLDWADWYPKPSRYSKEKVAKYSAQTQHPYQKFLVGIGRRLFIEKETSYLP
jgi:hypothetical protein